MCSFSLKSIESNPDLEYRNSKAIAANGQMNLAELVNEKQRRWSMAMFCQVMKIYNLQKGTLTLVGPPNFNFILLAD